MRKFLLHGEYDLIDLKDRLSTLMEEGVLDMHDGLDVSVLTLQLNRDHGIRQTKCYTRRESAL